MRASVVYKANGDKTYVIDGEEVSRTEYESRVPHKLKDVFASRKAADGHRPACWPMASDAAGVNPDQIKEAMEGARKAGVPTEFNRDGQAIFTSREHRKRYCKALGFYDRSGTYGDA